MSRLRPGTRLVRRLSEFAVRFPLRPGRRLSDPLADMSHELRTPLSAILGHADLLERSGLAPEQADYVATIRKSAHNLLDLVDDVLAWRRLESGRAGAGEVGFNLAELIEDTLNLLAPLAFEKDLDLVYLLYRDVPRHLRGDPLRFQQILTNLVSNAIKFTDRGGVTIRLMLEDEDDETCTLRVSVVDTGPGIDAAEVDRLFDEYQRLQGAAAAPGSGLGLAISKRLLETMGGRITVDSKPGEGSDFQFVLSLKKALHREQRWVPWTALRGKRVWLADDYAPARLTLAHHLEFWRMDVREMGTRAELRDCLERPGLTPRPDVAIVGLRVADLDRREPLAELLRHCRRTGLPVLALVTSVDPEVLAGVETIGADRALPKSTPRPRLYRELCELTGVSMAGAPDTGRPLGGVPVLVADNSGATRRHLAALLDDLGADVVPATDGREALEAWRENGFPLILVDAEMPRMDGATAITAIRRETAGGRQPLVVAMTADADPRRRESLLAAGADTCLLKPFDGDTLWHALQPHLPSFPSAATSSLPRESKTSAALAEELPRRIEAIAAAVRDADRDRARAEVHTLHGTAAFYGLEDVRTVTAAIEAHLRDGGKIGDDDLRALRDAASEAFDTPNQSSFDK